MVTLVWDVTPVCVTLNVPEVLPAAIDIEPGVLAIFVFELLNVTVMPPAGAAAFSVTIPVTAIVELPLTAIGETDSEAIVTGLTVSVACLLLEPTTPVSVATTVDDTTLVVIANVAEVFPEATVTVPATPTEETLLDRSTTTPLLPAGAVSVTIPTAALPPRTEVGATEIDAT